MSDDGSSRLDDTDVRILTAVRQLYTRVDPVPAGLVERLTMAVTIEEFQTRLAVMQHLELAGSARSDGLDAGVAVTFVSRDFNAMVRVVPDVGRLSRIDGWTVGMTGVEVELSWRDGPARRLSLADENGQFSFAGVEPGLVTFTFGADGVQKVITPAMEIESRGE